MAPTLEGATSSGRRVQNYRVTVPYVIWGGGVRSLQREARLLRLRPRAPDLIAAVVVLGGGPVSVDIAQYAIEGAEMIAVLVEGELLGGECS